MQQCAALSASIFSPSASYMHFLKEGLSYTVGSCQRKELIPQNCEGEGDCWHHLAGVMKGALLYLFVPLQLLGMHLIAF